MHVSSTRRWMIFASASSLFVISQFYRAAIAALFHIREYWIISAGTFCRYGVYAAIQTLYAGPYLMNVMGLTPVQTGNILLGMNLDLHAALLHG